jgi:hypothetical protein
MQKVYETGYMEYLGCCGPSEGVEVVYLTGVILAAVVFDSIHRCIKCMQSHTSSTRHPTMTTLTTKITR